MDYNASASGGMAGGDYFPDRFDAFQANLRKSSSDNLMEYASANNARTHALQRMAAIGGLGARNAGQVDNLLFGSKQGFGIRTFAQASQSLLGSGNFTDLAYNLQQGMANGGFYTNFGGVNRLSGGGGATNDAMAKMMFDRMNNQFFDKSGFGVNSRLQGRDPTELGRAVGILSGNGAFAGMEIGSFGSKSVLNRARDAASDLRGSGRYEEADILSKAIRNGSQDDSSVMGRIRGLQNDKTLSGKSGLQQSLNTIQNTNFGFTMNEQTAKQITEKTTDFFKMMDSLSNVIQGVSDIDSVKWMKTLTGVGVGGNIKEATAKIDALKTQAKSLGVSERQVFETVASSAGMYQQMGFGETASSQLASISTLNGFAVAKESTAFAGAQARLGRYAPNINQNSVIQRNAAEEAGLMREDTTRLALEMRYNSVYDSRVKGNAGYLAAVDAIDNARTPAERAEAHSRALAMQGSLGISRLNISDTVLTDGISNSEQGAAYVRGLSKQKNSVKYRNFLSKSKEIGSNRGWGSFSGTGGDLMDTLTGAFDMSTTQSILDAMKSGDMEKVSAIINASDNSNFLTQYGASSGGVLSQINSLSGKMGGLGNLGNAADMGITQLRQQGNLSNRISVQSQYGSDAAAAAMDGMSTAAGWSRDQKQKSIAQSILSGIMKGGTATLDENAVFNSVFADDSKVRQLDSIGYDAKKRSFSFSDKQKEFFSKNKQFMDSLGLSTGNKKGLEGVLGADNNAHMLKTALMSSGMKVKQRKADGDIYLMNKEQYDAAEGSVLDSSYGESLAYLTGGVKFSGEEVHKLAGGEADADLRQRVQEQAMQRYNKDGGDNLSSLIGDAISTKGAVKASASIGLLNNRFGTLDSATRNSAFADVLKTHKSDIEAITGTKIEDVKSPEAYKQLLVALDKIVDMQKQKDEEDKNSQKVAVMKVDRIEVTHMNK